MDNETEPEVTDDVVFNIVGACAWTITTLLILLLNTVCLFILPKVKEFHHATKIFLQSMTVGDLMLGVFFYLPMIGISLEGRTWPYGDGLCYVQAWMIRQALPANTMSLLLVTIDRYIAVVYPMRYNKWLTSRRAKIVVCLLWILTNLYTLILSMVYHKQVKTYNKHLFICQFGKETDTVPALVLTILTLAVIVMIILMYIHILSIARSQASRIAKQHHLVTSDGDWQTQRYNRKSFTTIFIVTMALFLGWLPSVIMGLMRASPEFAPQLRAFSQILLASVSWVNVIIYYVRNRAFRAAGHNFLLKMSRNCCGYWNATSKSIGHNTSSF